MPETTISFQEVTKSFGDVTVLDHASLEISSGEAVAILGASGSGKSVTLKTINGLIPCDAGEIRVLGEKVSEMNEEELVPLRRRVSYLFQGGALFDSMNVFGNVAFPIKEHTDLEGGGLEERVRELLSLVQLEGIEKLVPSELSGGMRKRVALARALALEPEIILYDEPTTGLDPVTGTAIAALIKDLHRRLGVTSLVVTHDIPLVKNVAERVVFLEDGRFVFSGSLTEAQEIAPIQVQRFFSAGGNNA